MKDNIKLNFYWRGYRLGQIEKTKNGYIYTSNIKNEQRYEMEICSTYKLFGSNERESAELFPEFKKTIEGIETALPRILVKDAPKYQYGSEMDALIKVALEKWNISPDDSEWDKLVKFAQRMKDADALTLKVNHIEYYVKPVEGLSKTATEDKQNALVTTKDGHSEKWVVL